MSAHHTHATTPLSEGATKDTSGDVVVLIGHGSSQRPVSGQGIQKLADLLNARGIFKSVQAGFLKQEPFAKDILETVAADCIYLVPVMAHAGFITQEIIPKELNLTGTITIRPNDGNDQKIVLCEPIGTHTDIPKLMVERIAFSLENNEIDAVNTGIILVGHGSGKNDASKQHTALIAQQIQALGLRTEIHPLFLEQSPLLQSWAEISSHQTLIVVPLLLSSGRHGAEDIPEAFGIDHRTLIYDQADGLAAGPYPSQDRQIWFLRPLGEDPALADITLVHIQAHIQAHHQKCAEDALKK